MSNGESMYRRYLEGDDGGLVEIIKEYRDPLVLFLHGIMRDEAAAEEVAEETFFILAAKKPRFGGKSSFKTWIYAIAKNTALKELKRNSKRGELDENTLGECDLEEELIKSERNLAIARALKMINPDYREILYLVFIEGFSNGDAARIMKKSTKQIENLLYRAKGALKQELTKEGFTYKDL